jgi:hypothetical protein
MTRRIGKHIETVSLTEQTIEIRYDGPELTAQQKIDVEAFWRRRIDKLQRELIDGLTSSLAALEARAPAPPIAAAAPRCTCGQWAVLHQPGCPCFYVST